MQHVLFRCSNKKQYYYRVRVPKIHALATSFPIFSILSSFVIATRCCLCILYSRWHHKVHAFVTSNQLIATSYFHSLQAIFTAYKLFSQLQAIFTATSYFHSILELLVLPGTPFSDCLHMLTK